MTIHTVTPKQWTACRWCHTPLTSIWIAPWLLRIGFCSTACMRERFTEEG